MKNLLILILSMTLINCAKKSEDAPIAKSPCQENTIGSWTDGSLTFTFNNTCNGSAIAKGTANDCDFNFNYQRTENDNAFMMQLTSSTCGGGLVERLCIYSISNNVMNINCGKSDAYLVKK